jgi:hypothetical protein
MDRETFERLFREWRQQHPEGVPPGRVVPDTSEGARRRALELIRKHGLWHLLTNDEEREREKGK